MVVLIYLLLLHIYYMIHDHNYKIHIFYCFYTLETLKWDKKIELTKFYKEIKKYSLDKIISIDETSISPLMIMEYSRCDIGQRCIIKTDDNFVFKKFTLLCAISNKKCIGWKLYEKGGSTKERFIDFLQKNIFQNI